MCELPDLRGNAGQGQIFALGIMCDGQHGHAQTLVLNLVQLQLALRATQWSQAFQEVILALKKTHKQKQKQKTGFHMDICKYIDKHVLPFHTNTNTNKKQAFTWIYANI